MKIYFEDGELRKKYLLPESVDYIIDAGEGPTANISLLDWIRNNKPDAVIYTNSIFALNNRYAWNEELKVPDIYIRAGEFMLFFRIDTLTDRTLREGHNLAKMYISGEFDDAE